MFTYDADHDEILPIITEISDVTEEAENSRLLHIYSQLYSHQSFTSVETRNLHTSSYQHQNTWNSHPNHIVTHEAHMESRLSDTEENTEENCAPQSGRGITYFQGIISNLTIIYLQKPQT